MEHEISFTENRRSGLAVAWCSCGWRRAGALETVQRLAATHDIDQEADNGESKIDDE